MDGSISKSGRIRKINPNLRDFDLNDDLEGLAFLDSSNSSKAKDHSPGPSTSSSCLNSTPKLRSSTLGSRKTAPESIEKNLLQGKKSKLVSSASNRRKKVAVDDDLSVRLCDANAFKLFEQQLRIQYEKQNPNLSDTEFYLILKSEWKAMNNHERRLWRRRVKVKKPKQIDQQKTSIVPSKPSSSLKPRQTSNPSSAATYLFMSSQKLRKLGEQMKLQADQEVKKGINNPDVRGSLTGILDTLLASMSALISLTTQYPKIDVIPRDRLAETHSNVVAIIKSYKENEDG